MPFVSINLKYSILGNLQVRTKPQFQNILNIHKSNLLKISCFMQICQHMEVPFSFHSLFTRRENFEKLYIIKFLFNEHREI